MLGVLLMNTGTPDAPTEEAIKPYLKQFLSDRNLIDMPPALWQPILNLFILPNRPKRMAPLYQNIWTKEGSPFLLDSYAQRDALQKRLEELTEQPVKVALGMRYGNPSAESALRELKEADVDMLVVIPLYPQETKSCAGTCLQEFERACKQVYGGSAVPHVTFVRYYYDAPGYIEALAASVKRSWTWKAGSKLVLSFHSIPVSHVEAGDKYVQQTEDTAHTLADALSIPREDVVLAYQSRFDSRKWVGPMLKPMLTQLAAEGVSDVAVVCPGFSVDCLETLHEIKKLAAQHYLNECERVGIQSARFTAVPALGADPAFIDSLAQLIVRKASGE